MQNKKKLYKRQFYPASQRQIQEEDITRSRELCGHVSSQPTFNDCQGSFTAGRTGTFGVLRLWGSLWGLGSALADVLLRCGSSVSVLERELLRGTQELVELKEK